MREHRVCNPVIPRRRVLFTRKSSFQLLKCERGIGDSLFPTNTRDTLKPVTREPLLPFPGPHREEGEGSFHSKTFRQVFSLCLRVAVVRQGSGPAIIYRLHHAPHMPQRSVGPEIVAPRLPGLLTERVLFSVCVPSHTLEIAATSFRRVAAKASPSSIQAVCLIPAPWECRSIRPCTRAGLPGW